MRGQRLSNSSAAAAEGVIETGEVPRWYLFICLFLGIKSRNEL